MQEGGGENVSVGASEAEGFDGGERVGMDGM
jgi:hypothetical protein